MVFLHLLELFKIALFKINLMKILLILRFGSFASWVPIVQLKKRLLKRVEWKQRVASTKYPLFSKNILGLPPYGLLEIFPIKALAFEIYNFIVSNYAKADGLTLNRTTRFLKWTISSFPNFFDKNDACRTSPRTPLHLLFWKLEK